MKNYKKLLVLLLIILGVSTFFVFFDLRQKANTQKQEVAQELKTTLSINIDSKVESFDIFKYIGKTALEATLANAKVAVSGTGVNAFVTTIDGRVAVSQKHEFWELDANGAETQVGAGSYIIQKGDSILWHINTY